MTSMQNLMKRFHLIIIQPKFRLFPDLKHLTPIQVLFSQTAVKREGKVMISTMVGREKRKWMNVSAARSLRKAYRRKMMARAKSIWMVILWSQETHSSIKPKYNFRLKA